MRGARLTKHDQANAVVVGWHEDLTLDGLTGAVRHVLGGARLLATNEDPLRPSHDGPVPGAGSFVAAVEAATGASARYAGKPHEPMADLIHRHLLGTTIVVGDSARTDGGLAASIGAQFALVRSGNHVDEARHSGYVASDLQEIVRTVLGLGDS
jgi:ribonucleotide monophosphatase NagD (HAD superfamily)